MKKTQGSKNQKISAKISKKVVASPRKISNRAKRKAGKIRTKTRNLLGKAKKKLNAMKKSSALQRTKKKIHATEEEIMDYVKDNPIKSISAIALTGLIAGFLTYRNKK